MYGCAWARPSWDNSESRDNSFSRADERALRQMRGPLRIVVQLAPEDPRRADLERRALSKLRRVMRDLEVEYRSATSIGMFEQTRAGYGEIWYAMNGRKTMSRATTEEGVLEAIYEVAGITAPNDGGEAVFRGHPLAALPTGAPTIFYCLWPASVLLSGMLVRRRFQ